jgi:hypothetical protein
MTDATLLEELGRELRGCYSATTEQPLPEYLLKITAEAADTREPSTGVPLVSEHTGHLPRPRAVRSQKWEEPLVLGRAAGGFTWLRFLWRLCLS